MRSSPLAGPWIGGPVYDLVFFFGAGAVAVAAGLIAWAWPATVAALWFAWLLLLDGPHLLATWQRTYLDEHTRRERPGLLWAGLAWLLPGPLLLAVSWVTGHGEPFLLFLAAAALWSFHHGVRQLHGIQALYQRLGRASPPAARTDRQLLHVVFWSTVALFLYAHPANRAALGLPASAGALDAVVISCLGAFLVAAVVLWGGLLVRRWQQGQAVRPGLFGLVVASGTNLFGLLVIGLHEPLLAATTSVEQVFLTAAVVGGVLHGMHYLGITFVAEGRRRAAHWPGALRVYAVLVGLSVLYIGINLLRGAAPVSAPWVAIDSPLAQAFLALYWGLFTQHYWIDQKIWHPSSDARLRHELGLEPA